MKTWGVHHNSDPGALGRSNSEKHMKHLAFATIVVLNLVACSPPEDQQPKKPVRIDKAQIDLAEMNTFVKDSPSRTNWFCLFAKSKLQDEDQATGRSQRLQGRSIYITDGREVLATGRITGILNMEGKFAGLDIVFPTPQIKDDMEKRLGIHHGEMSPPLPATTNHPPSPAQPSAYAGAQETNSTNMAK